MYPCISSASNAARLSAPGVGEGAGEGAGVAVGGGVAVAEPPQEIATNAAIANRAAIHLFCSLTNAFWLICCCIVGHIVLNMPHRATGVRLWLIHSQVIIIHPVFTINDSPVPALDAVS